MSIISNLKLPRTSILNQIHFIISFKGFGFVYFMSEVTAERVIHQKYFWINDKKVSEISLVF